MTNQSHADSCIDLAAMLVTNIACIYKPVIIANYQINQLKHRKYYTSLDCYIEATNKTTLSDQSIKHCDYTTF